MALLAFDLDGVLYSSEPFLGDAYREAIATVNGRHPGAFARVPTTAEILQHVGWPLPVIFANLFPDAAAAALADLHEETLVVICRRVAAGHTLVVASNGRTRYVETVLATYDVGDCFLPRVTADDVGDKTAILRHYLAAVPATPARTVMIGDRVSDVDAARAVACRFVGCDYGHGHRAEIETAGPLVQRFADLPATLAALLP